jgi:hypothetical protein
MHFRTARHTNRLDPLITFYTEVIGLDLLGEFHDHDGYDGVFIGPKDADWHLEFTRTNEQVVHHFHDDDLLVLYPRTMVEYTGILHRLHQRGVFEEPAKNPYWNLHGRLFRDPDGQGIIITDQRIAALGSERTPHP